MPKMVISSSKSNKKYIFLSPKDGMSNKNMLVLSRMDLVRVEKQDCMRIGFLIRKNTGQRQMRQTGQEGQRPGENESMLR